MLKKVISIFRNTPVEKKELSPFSPYMSFVNYLALNGWSNLSAYQSMQYYMQVDPLYDAISTIATEGSSIRLFTQDVNTEEFERNHAVLDLLKRPNTDMGYSEFMEQLISYYLITGNCYLIKTAMPNRPPLELFAVSPEYITLIPDERDGYTKTIFYTSTARNIAFNREEVNGKFRFFSEDHMQEAYHIRKFNPIRGITNNYGLSPLAPIYYLIEQYIKASVHNLAILTRGGRPSGALTTKETLTDDNFARLQEQMDRFYAGAENAGRLLLFDSGIEFKEMALNQKDMDFEKLQQRIIAGIYNTLKIPLALISPAVMSYNNLETAKLSLYDFAVLPIMSRILEELSIFLIASYGEEKTTRLAYNIDTIPALQIRRNEELLALKNLGIYTINELRAMRGSEAAIGGNDIYMPAANLPVARVGDKILDAEIVTDREEESAKSLKIDYAHRLQKLKQPNGLQAFSNDEIKQRVKSYGLE